MSYDWIEYSYERGTVVGYSDTSTKYKLLIEFEKMEVHYITQALYVDLNTLFSSVGGSLGLFLGFSIIGTFTYFYNLILKPNSFNIFF